VEGLAYLTFDADVKEDFVEDKNALLAMFELAKVIGGFNTCDTWTIHISLCVVCESNTIITYPKHLWSVDNLGLLVLLQSEDKTVLFAVGSTLVNCTNSYEVEKPDPQMVELAKYAKQHVPEEHPKVPFKLLIFHIELHLQHNMILLK